MIPQSLLLEREKGGGGNEIPHPGKREEGENATLFYSFAVFGAAVPNGTECIAPNTTKTWNVEVQNTYSPI